MNRYDDRYWRERGYEPLDDEEIAQRMRDEEPLPVIYPKPRAHRDLDAIDDPAEGPPSLTEWQRRQGEE